MQQCMTAVCLPPYLAGITTVYHSEIKREQPYEGPVAASVSIATVGRGDCLLSESGRLSEWEILHVYAE